jgi:translation initiation factor 3 subunit B
VGQQARATRCDDSDACRESLENFWNFAWRPRPPSQLPAEKEREIVKNLRGYAKRYEEEDELLMAAAGSEQLQRRQQLRLQWEAWSAGKEEWRAAQASHMCSVLGYLPQEPPSTTVEKTIEQVVDVKEEPYSG